jgi:flagellar hook assembly protein FlgD
MLTTTTSKACPKKAKGFTFFLVIVSLFLFFNLQGIEPSLHQKSLTTTLKGKLLLIEKSPAFSDLSIHLAILHEFGEHILTVADDSDILLFDEISVQYQILDHNFSITSHFLVTGKTEHLPFHDLDILYQENNTAIIKADKPSLTDLSEGTILVHPLQKIEKNLEYTGRYLNYNPEILNNPVINNIIAALNNDSYSSYISHLENYETRYFLHPNRQEITNWLSSEFSDFGIHKVAIDSFYVSDYVWGDFPPSWQSNVIATIEGQTHPETHLVIGGHYDSIVTTYSDDPMQIAPGADDNASGAAALLEIARALQLTGYAPQKSISFLAFGAEEIGLYGSKHAAEEMSDLNLEIMLNNDMIAYLPAGDESPKIKIYPYSGFEYLSDLSKHIFLNHTSIEPYVSYSNNPSSDSYSFWQKGLATLFLHEYHFNPHYHSPDDLLANCDTDYALEIVKASALKLLYLDQIPPAITDLTVVNSGNGQEVKLSWSHSTQEDINFFYVYYGGKPGSYDQLTMSYTTETTISGLQEGREYYFAVSAINREGFESIIIEKSLVPDSQPQTPEGFSITPYEDHVILTWNDNTEGDLAGYEIYRGTKSSVLTLYETLYTENNFTDYNLKEKEFYYYAVAAIDSSGNSSTLTEIIRIGLVSLNRGILLLDATPSGNGSFLYPEKRELFHYYDSQLSQFITDYIDVSQLKNLSLTDIGPYSTVFLFNDSAGYPTLIKDANDTFREYLSRGGNLIVSGFHPFYHFQENLQYPFLFEEESFISEYLQIEAASHQFGSYFLTAKPLLETYPEVSTDPDKTPIETDNHLLQIAAFSPLNGSTPFYSYQSGFPDHGLSGGMSDLIIGSIVEKSDYSAVILSFPLYYMQPQETQTLLSKLMTEVFSEKLWSGEEIGFSNKKAIVLPNYPNPFTDNTVISFYVDHDTRSSLKIYNIKGQIVTTLFKDERVLGRVKLQWNGQNDSGSHLPSGLYFVSLETASGHRDTGKLVLVR